jgi:hypothetical protein
MRAYALYNKNNYVLLVLTALAVLSVVVGFVRTFPARHLTLFADRVVDCDHH